MFCRWIFGPNLWPRFVGKLNLLNIVETAENHNYHLYTNGLL